MKNNTKAILIVIAGALLVMFGANYYVQAKQAQTKEVLHEQVTTKLQEVQLTAERVYANIGDSVTATYVRDCNPESRQVFDNYLNNLGKLSPEDLDKVSILFEACASFFADEKAAMVERLQLQFQQLHDLVTAYSIIDSSVTQDYDIEGWQQFLALSKQQAELLANQLPLQEKIIILLKEGKGPGDPAIRVHMTEAQEITQTGAVVGKQIETTYSKLKSL